jgi:hypothetical protein
MELSKSTLRNSELFDMEDGVTSTESFGVKNGQVLFIVDDLGGVTWWKLSEVQTARPRRSGRRTYEEESHLANRRDTTKP